MRKVKYTIEYVFDKASKSALWPRVSTAAGLAEWFADDVKDDGETFEFIWNGHPQEAELMTLSPGSHIRFHWVEEEPDTFFEFRLHTIELTGALMLAITDFAEPDEEGDARALWEKQIKDLKRLLGI